MRAPLSRNLKPVVSLPSSPSPLGFHPCGGGRGSRFSLHAFLSSHLSPSLFHSHVLHRFIFPASPLFRSVNLELVFDKSSMSKFSGDLNEAVFNRRGLDLGYGMKIKAGLASRCTKTVPFENDLVRSRLGEVRIYNIFAFAAMYLQFEVHLCDM